MAWTGRPRSRAAFGRLRTHAEAPAGPGGPSDDAALFGALARQEADGVGAGDQQRVVAPRWRRGRRPPRTSLPEARCGSWAPSPASARRRRAGRTSSRTALACVAGDEDALAEQRERLEPAEALAQSHHVADHHGGRSAEPAACAPGGSRSRRAAPPSTRCDGQRAVHDDGGRGLGITAAGQQGVRRSPSSLRMPIRITSVSTAVASSPQRVSSATCVGSLWPVTTAKDAA